jgi:RNA polymerase sigma-70 factor (ECF subfamily)
MGDPVRNTEFPDLYNQLRDLAHQHLNRESQRQLSTTELVHEAYLKLGPSPTGGFNNESHVLAVASRQMRCILVDHARARNAKKRGGDWVRIELDENISPMSDGFVDVLDLENALTRLEALHPRAASVVEMRFFAGMTVKQIATHLMCSERWVRKLWMFARAWLQRDLALGS